MDTATGSASGTTTTGGAVRLPEGSTLKDCNVYWACFIGVEVDGTGSNAQVLGCNIYDAGCTGVQVTGTGWTVQNCDIESNNSRNFDVTWGAAGMKIIPNSAGDVKQNMVASNNASGIWCDTDLGGSSDVITIEQNLVENNIPVNAAYPNAPTPFIWNEAGIKVEVSEYVNVFNNIVSRNASNGILVSGSQHVNVLNNTVTSNFGEAGIAMNTDGERVVHSMNAVTTNNNFLNNIIAHNSTTYDLMMAAPQTTWVASNISDYNDFYRIGEPLQITLGNPTDDGGNSGTASTVMGPVQTTLGGWQSYSGQDAAQQIGRSGIWGLQRFLELQPEHQHLYTGQPRSARQQQPAD